MKQKPQRTIRIQITLNLENEYDKLLYQTLDAHEGSLNLFLKKTLLIALTSIDPDDIKNKKQKIKVKKTTEDIKLPSEVNQDKETVTSDNKPEVL